MKKIELGNICNNNCAFCCFLDRKIRKNKTYGKIKKELDNIKKQGINEILISGGEPTIRKDFFDILKYIKKQNFNASLESNGRIFYYKNFCEKIKKFNIKTFFIYLFTDKSSKVNGSFEQTLQGIKNLKELNQDIQINLVVNRNNFIILPLIINRLIKLNITKLQIIFPEPIIGKEYLFNDNIPTIHEAFLYIEKAISLIKKNNIKLIPNNRSFNYKKPKNLLLGCNKIKPSYAILKHNSKKEVSIVIPTYNRKQFLRKTLNALFNQNYPKDKYEIIIVDDGSDDKTNDMIKKLNPPCNLKYLYWPRKEKFVRGKPLNRAGPVRNLGVKFASGNIIIFVDCDIAVCKDFIKEHLKSQKKADIVIGPSIREDSGNDQRERYFSICNDDLENTDMITWELTHEGNISFKKKDFLEVGGFSDEFVYWAFEGDDLAYRLINWTGKKIVLNRKAKGIHLKHPSEYINKKIQLIGGIYNGEVLYKKYLDKEIYYRFFAHPSYKGYGNIKKCIKKDFRKVPFSMLLTLCVESAKCDDISLCKCQPRIVKELITNKAGEFKTIFFRDDDIGHLTPNLKKLVELFISENVPINLQLIPSKLTKESIKWFKLMKEKYPSLICLNQHGFNHRIKWVNKKPHEFGGGRSYNSQFIALKKGKKKLEQIFGNKFFPAFTPPFHTYDKNTIKALENLNFHVFSSSNEGNKINSGIKEISVDLDPIEEYFPETKRKKEDDFLKEFINLKNKKTRIGIVLHHEMMNYSDFKIIERLIKLLKMNKNIIFENFQDICKEKSKIDVLLINPSYQPHWSKCEPSGLIILATYLNKKEFKTRILDFNVIGFDKEYLRNYILENKPLIIGISSLTRQALRGYSIGNFIKKEFPNITLIYGGVHTTAVPEEPFKLGSADIVVIGEGENTFLEIVNKLKKKTLDKNKIKGIAFKNNGRIIKTEPREFIEDLDVIPIPDYDLVNLNDYNTEIHLTKYKGQPAVHLMTTRGCYYNCSYCNSPSLYKNRIRKFSIKRVIEELKYIKEVQGIKNIHFHDDIFIFDQKRTEELCKAMITEKLQMNWICLDRIELIIKNQHLLKLMKEAGCKGIEIGIESADNSVFKKINKIQKIEDIKKANKIILEERITPMYLMMAYPPGETLNTPYNSIQLLNELFGFDITKERDDNKLKEVKSRLMSHMTRASPGARFYETAEKEGLILNKNWNYHYEEKINFLPFSFLNDIPQKKEELSKEIVLNKLLENKKAIKVFSETNHYIPKNMYEVFSNLNDYLDFVVFVYTLCNGEKTVQELFSNFSKNYRKIGIDLFCSAVALLSIYGLIRSNKKIISNIKFIPFEVRYINYLINTGRKYRQYWEDDSPLINKKSLKNFLKKNSKNIWIFTINSKLAGIIYLTDIKRNNSAHIHGTLEKKYWSKGISNEVIKKFLYYLFTKMQFKKIYATISETNIPTINLCKKQGFSFRNREKKDCIIKRKKYDRLIFLLKKENFMNKFNYLPKLE